jgi:hypothetical protein
MISGQKSPESRLRTGTSSIVRGNFGLDCKKTAQLFVTGTSFLVFIPQIHLNLLTHCTLAANSGNRDDCREYFTVNPPANTGFRTHNICKEIQIFDDIQDGNKMQSMLLTSRLVYRCKAVYIPFYDYFMPTANLYLGVN